MAASRWVFEPGETVGRYSILRAIGSGPHFDVYQARAFGVEGFERDVALKLVRDPALATDAGFREALGRALSLSHAGVLQLVDSDVIERDGATRVYFVTELARGERLADVRATWLETAQGRARLLQLGSDVARVLDYAARRRKGAVTHGRLHAGQIFVGARGEAKVADFSVSAAAERADAGEAPSDLASLGDLIEGADADPAFLELLVELRAGALSPQRAAEELLGWALRAREEPAPVVLDLHLERTPPPSEASTPSEPPVPGTPAPSEVASSAVARPRGNPTGRFVGRHRELALLGQAIAHVASEGARWLHVTGGPGIGATRLVAELARRVPTDRVTTTRVDADGLTPLATARAAVRALLDLPEDADLAARVGTLRATGLTRPEIDGVFELLGVSRAAGSLGEPQEEAEPAASPARALLAVVRALQGRRPLVLTFAGEPPVDDASARLFRDALVREEAREAPVLLLSTDPAGDPSSAPERETALGLEGLGDDDLAQLVSARVGARVLEPELFEAVASVAGGNPLFAEELLRHLAAEALLVVHGGVASLRASSADVPPSLGALAAAARARLGEPAKAALVALEACGLVADRAALAAALDAAPLADAGLTELVAEGIVRMDEHGRAHLPRGYAPGEAFSTEGHARLAAHFEARARELVAGGDVVAAANFERAAAHALRADGGRARAGGLFQEASDAHAEKGAFGSALSALLEALAASEGSAEASARLARLERLLEGVATPPEGLEEALAHGLSLLDGDANETTALVERLVVALTQVGALETALVLLDRNGGALGPDRSAELRVAVAVRAANPTLAEGAREALAAAGSPSARRTLDVAEWAWLRGDFADAEALVASLPSALSAVDRVRARRLSVQVATSLGAIVGDDPRLDELVALAVPLGVEREAARAYFAAGTALRRSASAQHRARAQFLLREAELLAEAAHEPRTALLARAERALATRRQAAQREVLAVADRARAAGEAFAWLWLRAAVADLGGDSRGLAVAAIARDARSAGLEGLAAEVEREP